MLRKIIMLALLALSLAGGLMTRTNLFAFDGPDPPPPCSPKTCPQPPAR